MGGISGEVIANSLRTAQSGISQRSPRPTRRWREMDSKFQFRDASPLPSVSAFIGLEWPLLQPRNSSIGLPRPTTGWKYRRADGRSGPTPTEASKPLPISRGTEVRDRFPPAHTPLPTRISGSEPFLGKRVESSLRKNLPAEYRTATGAGCIRDCLASASAKSRGGNDMG